MIYVIGAVSVDMIAIKDRFLAGTSNPARIRLGLGGVGYRIFHHLPEPKRFFSAAGTDFSGEWITERLAGLPGVVLNRVDGYGTACYLAFMESGELKYAASDMRVIEEGLSAEKVREFLAEAGEGDFLIMEANLSAALVRNLLNEYASRMKCVFESVSVEKSLRHRGSLRGLFLLSANQDEFTALSLRAGREESFLEERNIEHLLVTRGRRGASLYMRAGKRIDFRPARTIKARDTTGAGDRLLSAIIEGVSRGLRIEEAVPAALCEVEKAIEEEKL